MFDARGKAPVQDAPEEASGFRRWLGGNAWRFVLLFVGVLAPLAIFVELAEEVHELETFHFDVPLLWRMHGWHGPVLDQAVVLITRLGYEWFLIPADVLIPLALLLWRRWREACFATLAFAGSALLNLATKQFFQRDRPTLWESIAPEPTYSFPSGHAMGSMTFACTVILLTWNTRWRWPVLAAAVTFAVLVSASRIYLGVHYPSDILAGWCAAIAWVIGCYLVLFRQHPPGGARRGSVSPAGARSDGSGPSREPPMKNDAL